MMERRTVRTNHKKVSMFAEQQEFDFYLQFDWPEHIETALRRMLWIALVEEAEFDGRCHQHTQNLRWLIATHPDSPAEVLEFLATKIDDEKLLARVAEHKQTAPHTLECLAKHQSGDVRLAVADNPSTPLAVLLELAVSSDPDVRYCMAENPTLPAKMLQQLAADSNAYVAHRAARTMMRRNPAPVQQLPIRPPQDKQQRKAM